MCAVIEVGFAATGAVTGLVALFTEAGGLSVPGSAEGRRGKERLLSVFSGEEVLDDTAGAAVG